MKNHWIVIDATYMCHRAYHSTPPLSHEGVPTGVIYLFLQELHRLETRFATHRLVFCWDHGIGLREQRFPFYKETRRKDNSPEKERKQEILQPQIKLLKENILPRIGYRNNFFQTGYEADDVIASVIHNTIGEWKTRKRFDRFTIVSADEDLYQLIQEDVETFHPRNCEYMDLEKFKDEYGIHPTAWAGVKALAGCKTDDVPGMKGVGVETALRYFTMKLSPERMKQIKEFMNSKQAAQNYMLVKLPYKGIREFDLRDDKRNDKVYRQVLSEYGIKTIGA